MRVTAVIPARIGGRRFPGKVLYPYRGKPLLFYVWNEVRRSKRIDHLVIATSDDAVEEAARGFGAEVIRTSKRHHTGSDRVAEAIRRVGGEIIVNVQADRFGLTGRLLDRVLDGFIRTRNCAFGTMATAIESDDDLFDPNSVKVVVSPDGYALWFSRYPIPFIQHPTKGVRHVQFAFRHHIGVYLFRRSGLREYASWKRTPLERAESLEQLRILEHGKRMKVFDVKGTTVSIDSPSDLRKLDRIYR